MNVLVKDLLELSALESGIFKIIFEKVNVSEVVHSILESFRKVEKKKNLKVECKIDSNKIRLTQLLGNLIGNAYEYADHSGKITIEMVVTETLVRLIVGNTGTIISEESSDKIWDSFYRVDTDHEGNGLGLVIVKSLVELHNGNICAYTTSTMDYFELTLPILNKHTKIY